MTDDHTHRGDDVHSVELAAREANGGWQPIETEQRGIRCLIATPNGRHYKVRMLNGHLFPPNRASDHQNGNIFATHWMPLPAAPTEDLTPHP
jgi:hypothetical protein